VTEFFLLLSRPTLTWPQSWKAAPGANSLVACDVPRMTAYGARPSPRMLQQRSADRSETRRWRSAPDLSPHIAASDLPCVVRSFRVGWSLCENAQEPTRRRIVFSIALFPVATAAPFLFRLTKSRRTFYAQIECLCFHTASVDTGPLALVDWARHVGASQQQSGINNHAAECHV